MLNNLSIIGILLIIVIIGSIILGIRYYIQNKEEKSNKKPVEDIFEDLGIESNSPKVKAEIKVIKNKTYNTGKDKPKTNIKKVQSPPTPKIKSTKRKITKKKSRNG